MSKKLTGEEQLGFVQAVGIICIEGAVKHMLATAPPGVYTATENYKTRCGRDATEMGVPMTHEKVAQALECEPCFREVRRFVLNREAVA